MLVYFPEETGTCQHTSLFTGMDKWDLLKLGISRIFKIHQN
jgi:hypothetical protein